MNILIYWLEVTTKGLKKNEIEDIKSTLGFESEICTDKDELCENEFLCMLKHEYGYNMLCDVDPVLAEEDEIDDPDEWRSYKIEHFNEAEKADYELYKKYVLNFMDQGAIIKETLFDVLSSKKAEIKALNEKYGYGRFVLNAIVCLKEENEGYNQYLDSDMLALLSETGIIPQTLIALYDYCLYYVADLCTEREGMKNIICNRAAKTIHKK